VLTARAAGAVSRIFKRLGDPVRAGETLAVIESREAAQIAADRSVAAARANLAGKVLDREKRLYEQRVSPRQDFEQAQAEAAAAQAEAHRAQVAAGAARISTDGRGVLVTSPISGRVMAAPAHLGAYVQPETELFRVANPDLIQVEASLSGAAAQRIAPGDRAVVATLDGRSISASVRSVTPGLSENTRAATAVLDIAGVSGLRAGQLVQVRIMPAGAPTSAAIVVPEQAVQTVEGRDVVFVRTAAGFQTAPVRVGQRSAGRAEILAGLKAGQQIAVKNAFLLKAEMGKGEGEED
jgi:cobalt-zinc-cadmium efflux system membrane fusion protein